MTQSHKSVTTEFLHQILRALQGIGQVQAPARIPTPPRLGVLVGPNPETDADNDRPRAMSCWMSFGSCLRSKPNCGQNRWRPARRIQAVATEQRKR